MNIVIMLALISLLIIVHEAGHFTLAKLFGLRVSKFGIGLPFGPTLYKKKIGHTVFIIHALLLGGYVSFPDDNAPENKKEFDDIEEEEIPDDSPLLYKNKNAFEQACVLIAGVLFNVIFAIILIFATAFYYGKLPSGNYEVKIANIVQAKNTSNIKQKGLKAGDIIKSVNGVKITSPQQFLFIVKKSKPYDGYVSKERKDKIINEIILLNQMYDRQAVIKEGEVIILPRPTLEEPLDIDENVSKGFKTYKNKDIKLNKTEKHLSKELRNKTIFTMPYDAPIKSLALAIADNYKPVNIEILRGDKLITTNNLIPDIDGVYGIQITYTQKYASTKNLKDVTSASTRYLVDNTRLMIAGLVQLVTGKVSVKDMHGIVAITKIGGDIIEKNGIMDGLLLTSLISINLAIFNILPIPALDGGMLFFLIVEKLTGKKIDEKTFEKINSIFFYLLLTLMIFIVFNDIYAIISNKF